MTAEELKSKIRFETRNRGNFIVLTGGINFQAELLVSKSELQKTSDVMERSREEIRELILHEVYQDRRKELCEAIQEFISWHYPVPEAGDPWTGPTMSKASAAREKLLKLARYQPHSMDEKKI